MCVWVQLLIYGQNWVLCNVIVIICIVKLPRACIMKCIDSWIHKSTRLPDARLSANDRWCSCGHSSWWDPRNCENPISASPVCENGSRPCGTDASLNPEKPKASDPDPRAGSNSNLPSAQISWVPIWIVAVIGTVHSIWSGLTVSGEGGGVAKSIGAGDDAGDVGECCWWMLLWQLQQIAPVQTQNRVAGDYWHDEISWLPNIQPSHVVANWPENHLKQTMMLELVTTKDCSILHCILDRESVCRGCVKPFMNCLGLRARWKNGVT